MRRITAILLISIIGFILPTANVLASPREYFIDSGLALGNSDSWDIDTYGEISGGHSDSIPFQMEVGEMVQGEILLRKDPLRVSISDSTGKSIHDFGICSSRFSFYYTQCPDYGSQYYIVVTNPDAYSIGTRGYSWLRANIVPTDLPPCTGSGKNMNGDVTPYTPPVWTIIIIVVVILVIVVIFRRRRHRPSRTWVVKEYPADDYDDDDD